MEAAGLPNVRVSSVDNFQGEENDVILLSLVRNDGKGDDARRRGGEGTIGFLSTSNRVCVALTRARNGLFVFGNAGLLSAKFAARAATVEPRQNFAEVVGSTPDAPR